MSDLDLSNPYDPDQFPKPREEARVPPPPVRNADEAAKPPAPADSGAGKPPAAVPPASPAGPVPWKAAASSVPKLRQQPAALPESAASEGEFQGFAQDRMSTSGTSAIGEDWEDAPESRAGARTSPLSAALPLWEEWLERVRALPRQVVIGVGAGLLVVVLAFMFIPHGERSIPLSKIRQHPEAYDGRTVKVQGRAGETFHVGGSYVFNLQQGRDTIVVYSQTRHPGLHERVEAKGMVSIGYLDGAPRLALFEQSQTP